MKEDGLRTAYWFSNRITQMSRIFGTGFFDTVTALIYLSVKHVEHFHCT